MNAILRIALLGLIVGLVGGAVSAQQGQQQESPQQENPPASRPALPDTWLTGLRRAFIPLDQAQWSRYNSETFTIIRSAEPDARGLAGRNRNDTSNYNASDHYGIGRYLRFAILAGNEEGVKNALATVTRTLSGLNEAGGFQHVRRLTDNKVALRQGYDAAYLDARLLGDMCQGLLVAQEAGLLDAAFGRQNAPRIREGLEALARQAQPLLLHFSDRPDRLLVLANSFYACATLGQLQDARRYAEAFVRQAVRNRNARDLFLFYGGRDTGRSANAIVSAVDLLTLGYAEESAPRLRDMVQATANWLAARVDVRGELNATGNMITCPESRGFQGELREHDLGDLLFAFWRAGGYFSDGRLVHAAERIVARASESNIPDGFCFYRIE